MKYTKAEKARTRRVTAALDAIMDNDDNDWNEVVALMQNRGLRDMFVDARRAQGMTQAEFADQLGVTVESIIEWETCRWPDPHVSTLRRYSLVLGIHSRYDVVDRPTEPGETANQPDGTSEADDQ